MIIGHTTAALIAATMLKDQAYFSTQATHTPPRKPFVLSQRAFQQLKRSIPSLTGLPLHTLELSSYQQWGTMNTKSEQPLGYSIDSITLHDQLTQHSQPTLIELETLLEKIHATKEKIVFADGSQSLAHTLGKWHQEQTEPSYSYLTHCTLHHACLKAMQRYTPWGIFAWIPQSETSGACIITTSKPKDEWVDQIQQVWHRRLHIKTLCKTTQYHIQPSWRYNQSQSQYFLLGTSGLSTSPILARGLNTVIAQCHALKNNNTMQYHKLAQETFDFTKHLYKLSQISLLRGLSLHLMQNHWTQKQLIDWGQQTSVFEDHLCG